MKSMWRLGHQLDSFISQETHSTSVEVFGGRQHKQPDNIKQEKEFT